MNLKRITFWLLLFLSLSTVASAQQATKADIQALEARLSNLEITVKEMETRLTIQIKELDNRLTNKIEELDKRLNNRIEELDKRLNIAMSILVGVVLTAIALPQVLGYLISRHERQELQRQLQDQRSETQQQIQDLGAEILNQRAETQQQIQNLRTEIRDQRAETQQQIQN